MQPLDTDCKLQYPNQPTNKKVITMSKNKAWTTQDEDLLVAMRDEGTSFEAIGKQLKRSKSAVTGRYYKVRNSVRYTTTPAEDVTPTIDGDWVQELHATNERAHLMGEELAKVRLNMVIICLAVGALAIATAIVSLF
jgi:hypothetical protein